MDLSLARKRWEDWIGNMADVSVTLVLKSNKIGCLAENSSWANSRKLCIDV